MSLAYGLDPKLLQSLLAPLSAHPATRQILLFGSRARGQFKPGSDIDLALSAPGLSPSEFARLWNAVDDLPIVFKIDLLHLENLAPQEPLLAQIQRDAVVLWQAPAVAA